MPAYPIPKRLFLHAAAAMSVAACLAVTALGVRSYFRNDFLVKGPTVLWSEGGLAALEKGEPTSVRAWTWLTYKTDPWRTRTALSIELDPQQGRFVVPYWLLLLPPALLLWCLVKLGWPGGRSAPADACPSCGYDLRATRGACPECGAERAGP